MDSLNRLFSHQKTKSKNVAKNRLRQVLVHDRVNLPPGKMNRLRDDLAQVISKYVEIDQDRMNIALTDTTNRQSCLTAQVPIVGIFHNQ
jgi:cell division topological specificity factor